MSVARMQVRLAEAGVEKAVWELEMSWRMTEVVGRNVRVYNSLLWHCDIHVICVVSYMYMVSLVLPLQYMYGMIG